MFRKSQNNNEGHELIVFVNASNNNSQQNEFQKVCRELKKELELLHGENTFTYPNEYFKQEISLEIKNRREHFLYASIDELNETLKNNLENIVYTSLELINDIKRLQNQFTEPEESKKSNVYYANILQAVKKAIRNPEKKEISELRYLLTGQADSMYRNDKYNHTKNLNAKILLFVVAVTSLLLMFLIGFYAPLIIASVGCLKFHLALFTPIIPLLITMGYGLYVEKHYPLQPFSFFRIKKSIRTGREALVSAYQQKNIP